ncbi:7-carboxy-7-deazaguanine synthase QueE [Thiolapillus brandeum]|uniref:7-carboxy-7-deazaguanine synthase n=1 Tax=Thiolapillus brandeum TaxID=1076588 RepID=A0A7U6GK91_9GAMM|nr:7-carboxy-7-deazaguanine synthase QueE [Thiolapillus brandeum]BAO45147.1 queuosine biosynthesis protein QueE [Thiolapillus brandeum]
MSRLRVTEIFHSLQGESRSVGWPTVFVRLAGCPLRCEYCDTAYAFKGGEWMDVQEIHQQIGIYGCRHVTVTGGEPLAQKEAWPLLVSLCDAGYETSVETSGSLDISAIDPRVSIVMDIKTPGSGEVEKNRWENLSLLSEKDQIKLVIAHREDYEWARKQLQDRQLAEITEVLFSPVQGQLAPVDLADWILQDCLPVRFQLQLHKILWGDQPGR